MGRKHDGMDGLGLLYERRIHNLRKATPSRYCCDAAFVARHKKPALPLNVYGDFRLVV